MASQGELRALACLAGACASLLCSQWPKPAGPSGTAGMRRNFLALAASEKGPCCILFSLKKKRSLANPNKAPQRQGGWLLDKAPSGSFPQHLCTYCVGLSSPSSLLQLPGYSPSVAMALGTALPGAAWDWQTFPCLWAPFC